MGRWNTVDRDGQYVYDTRFGTDWNGEPISLTEIVASNTRQPDEPGSSSSPDGSADPADEPTVVTIRSTDDTPAAFYEFTVDGEVEPRGSLEDHDDISRDGAVRVVEGQFGPPGYDAYRVSGDILDWRAVDRDGDPVDASRFALLRDDEPVTVVELVSGS